MWLRSDLWIDHLPSANCWTKFCTCGHCHWRTRPPPSVVHLTHNVVLCSDAVELQMRKYAASFAVQSLHIHSLYNWYGCKSLKTTTMAEEYQQSDRVSIDVVEIEKELFEQPTYWEQSSKTQVISWGSQSPPNQVVKQARPTNDLRLIRS